jgi:hypothetical protein
MLFTLPIAIIGYAVISVTHSAKVKFGMTILMATGMYSSVPCILVWNSNNSAGHYKRATTTALQLAIANSGGFVACKSKIFQSRVARLELSICAQLSHISLRRLRNFIKVILLSLDFLLLRGSCEFDPLFRSFRPPADESLQCPRQCRILLEGES